MIGSIIEYLFAPDDPDAVIEKMAAESTRIVSLTVTEGGYNIHHVTGEFDTNPEVVNDLLPGATPRTTFGLVTEALRRRRDRGLEPFTVMSCDNLQGNGHRSRSAFTTFARLRDPELGEWGRREVRFPNSLVDRIIPVPTDADRSLARERLGVDDKWPVVCEPFAQWVLEDSFTAGRPPYEEAGVHVVADVEPYELMKLRLLNGSHQAMCYLAYLSGYRLVHHAAQDPLSGRSFSATWTPTACSLPGCARATWPRCSSAPTPTSSAPLTSRRAPRGSSTRFDKPSGTAPRTFRVNFVPLLRNGSAFTHGGLWFNTGADYSFDQIKLT